MTRKYQHAFTPQALTHDDRHHGLLALNLISRWNKWVKRRVENIELLNDTSVRRQCSVDFRLRSWFPKPRLHWDGDGIHYIPIAVLAKGSLVDFDVRDEAGRALPLLTRRKNSSIAAAALCSLAQLTTWVKLIEAHGLRTVAADPALPTDPRQIRLPRGLEEELVRITYLPPEDARTVLSNFLAADESAVKPLAHWAWQLKQPDSRSEEPYWDADVPESAWRYGLASNTQTRALLDDFAGSWMVSVPIKDEPLRRRILKFSYHEHRLEPQLGIVSRLKSLADTKGIGSRLDHAEDWLEGLPAGRGDEWKREHGGHRPSKPLQMGTWLRQAAAWEGFTIEFDTPAVGKGGSYHLELLAPEGTQIRRATLFATQGEKILDSHELRGARGLQRAHLYIGSMPARSEGKASVTLKPRSATLVRSLALLAFVSFVMLALAGLKLDTLTNRASGTSSTLAPVFLLLPGLGAAIVARAAEHAMTTSMLLGLRLLAMAVALGPLAGASLLAVARKWPHIGLAWSGIVILAGLCAIILAVSWRLASRRRPDGSAP
jgi:hypothetical protein